MVSKDYCLKSYILSIHKQAIKQSIANQIIMNRGPKQANKHVIHKQEDVSKNVKKNT